MKKKLIIAGIIVAVLIVVVVIYRKVNRKAVFTGNLLSSKTTPSAFPLQQGSRNNTAIRQLQTYLNAICIKPPLAMDPLVVDGDFGPKTAAAVNICLAGKSGHIKGQVSQLEFHELQTQYNQA